MAGFQTAQRPRPLFNQRPAMPVVPFERVGRKTPEPKPRAPVFVAPDEIAWEAAAQSASIMNGVRAKKIVADVAEKYGLGSHDIMSKSQARAVKDARHEAMAAVYLAFPQWSLKQIGRFFGGRDHTTVLHAVKRMGVWRSQGVSA